uniref:Synaptotagmin-5-like isoform X3 n=1 Tax=Nicotiana tabacum TaxID=4097 RepID=A0A1S4DJV1_TOBAC|nr:PREDICTED: synaptotagmin-5-like isoform X3 [Nicotiana tabacum]
MGRDRKIPHSRKIFTPDEYPSWVVFSNQQKLKWHNSHLKKLWPYVDEEASELETHIRKARSVALEKTRKSLLKRAEGIN